MEEAMNGKGYAHWKHIKEDFEKSGLREDEYCRKKGLNFRRFEKQRQEAEIYEEKHVNNSKTGLFVELEPEDEPSVSDLIMKDFTPGLRLTYREAVFDLPCDFEETTFKRALQIVREAL
jgi:hypothetical protein